jgi:hypothetical protein
LVGVSQNTSFLSIELRIVLQAERWDLKNGAEAH